MHSTVLRGTVGAFGCPDYDTPLVASDIGEGACHCGWYLQLRQTCLFVLCELKLNLFILDGYNQRLYFSQSSHHIPQHPNHLMGSLPVSNVTKLRKSFLWPPPASTDTKVQEGCFIVEIIVFTLGKSSKKTTDILRSG